MSQLPRIPVPSAQLPMPRISPGPDILGPIERVGRSVLRVSQARQTAEQSTKLLETLDQAIDAAEHQPTFRDAEPAFSGVIDPLADEFAQIEDPLVRTNMMNRLEFDRGRALIAVRRSAVKREGIAALAAENTRFEAALAAGGDPEKLSIERREALGDLVPTVLNPLEAAEQARAGDLRISRELYNRLLKEDPAAAGEFLKTPFAKKSIPADELDAKRREAQRDLIEHQSRIFENLFSQEREELFNASRQDGPRAFGSSVDEASKELAALPGTRASAEEIRVAILRDTLRAYALQGNADRFEMVAETMGDSLDATTEINRQQATLRSQQNQQASLDQAIFDIQASASMGFPLKDTPANRDAVDLMFGNMVQNGLDPTTEEGMDQVFKAFGNSTILPTPVTRFIQGVLLNPENQNADTITKAIMMANRLRTQHDGAWDRFGEEPKALLRTYNRIHAIGGDAKADYQLAWDSIFAADALNQAEVASRQGEWRRALNADFVDLVKSELEVKLPRTRGQRLFAGLDEEEELLDPRAIGDLLPTGMLEQYQAIAETHLISGKSFEASSSLAWEAVSKGMGVTGVFRDREVITRLAPEKTSNLTTDQIEENVSVAFFSDLALGLVRMPVPSNIQTPPSMMLTDALRNVINTKENPTAFQTALEQGNIPSVWRVSNFSELKKWDNNRLRLVASRTEELRAPEGGELLYRLVLVDDDGVEQMILRKNQAGEFGPYLISLTSGGYSQAESTRQQDILTREAQERRPSVFRRGLETIVEAVIAAPFPEPFPERNR